MAGARRWANLGVAAGGVTALLFAAFDVYQWTLAYLSDRYHNDLTFYYAAARVGLAHGWASIYDLGRLQQQLDAMGSGIRIAALARFISPPPMAWAALPFTVLPLPTAYLLWSALLLAALAATWWLVAPGGGRIRLLHLAAALGWLPVIYCLQLGQPGLFVALGVAASCVLLARGQQAWAGVALGVMVLKPQLAFLVPPALFAAGRYRAGWACVATLALLGLVSAAALGPDGIHVYSERLNWAATVPVNRVLTLRSLLADDMVTRAAQALIAVGALAAVFRFRRRRPEWIYVTAIVGGTLASPYLHLDDLLMLGLAAWLLVRAGAPAWALAYVVAAILVIEGEPFWGPVPVVLADLGGFVAIAGAALRPGARVAPPVAA